MIGIYKITNPNGKIYIGQSVNIEKRLKNYKNLNNCKKQYLLYRSLAKYGYENHVFEIIEECDIELLNKHERYYQDLYDVLNNGLNCKLTNTTDKSGKLSEEVKINISKGNIGKKRTEEQKQNISNSLKGRKIPEEVRLKMKHNALNMSEETKLKMSNSRKGGKNPLSKKVICTNTLKVWDSITECSNDLGIRMKLLSRYLNNNHPNKTTIIYLTEYEK